MEPCVRRQDTTLPLPTELADRLHSAAIRLLRTVRSVDMESGISGPRLSVLSVLVFRGPATITELAHAEQVKPPTISRMIKDMEWAGLVERRPDPSDGRVHRIRATRRGRGVLHEGRVRRVNALAESLKALDQNDRDTVAAAVTILERLHFSPEPS